MGGDEILVRARLAFDQTVSMDLCVRSSNPDLCQMVIACIG